jgi:hypothetical protein
MQVITNEKWLSSVAGGSPEPLLNGNFPPYIPPHAIVPLPQPPLGSISGDRSSVLPAT